MACRPVKVAKSTVAPPTHLEHEARSGMTSDDSGAQDRRETRAAKQEERTRGYGEAQADHDASQKAIEEKTVRLKALRLAKDKANEKP